MWLHILTGNTHDHVFRSCLCTISDKIVDAMVFSPLLLFKFYTFALVKLAYSPSPPPPPEYFCIVIPWTFSYLLATLNSWVERGGERGLVYDLGCGRDRLVILHITRTIQTWMCQLILTLIVVILIIRETFVQEDRQRGLITNGLSRSSFLSGTGKKGAEIVSKSPQQKYLCLG